MKVLLFIAVVAFLFGPLTVVLIREEVRQYRVRQEVRRIMAKMTADLTVVSRQIGEALIPALNKVTDACAAFAKAFNAPPAP